MAPKVALNPAQRVTVHAVGEFAYKDALGNTPQGEFTAELVPEPDNPYDNRAISIRFRDEVIAYIPRELTSRYWQSVSKVIADGAIPTVKARHTVSYGDYHEIDLYLLAGKASLPAKYQNAPSVKDAAVPEAYRKPSLTRHSIDSSHNSPPGLTNARLIDPDYSKKLETDGQKGNDFESTWLPDDRTQGPTTKPSSNSSQHGTIGCGVAAAIIIIIFLLL